MEAIDYIVLLLLFGTPVIVGAYFLYDRYLTERRGIDQTTYIRGLRAALNGDDASAFALFREAVSADSSNTDAYLRIGDLLRKHKKPDRALSVHRDLLIRHGLSRADRGAVLRAVTLDYLDLKDFAAASRSLTEYNKTVAGNAWGLQSLLAIQEATGQWAAAFETQEKLLKVSSEMSKKPLARYKFKEGELLAEQGEFHRARVAFKEALDYDESFAAAYVAIGDAYMAEERVNDAIAIWKKLTIIAPATSGTALMRLEKALFEIGRFGETEDICRAILRQDPTNLSARLRLAAYFAKKADTASAEEHLLLAADNNPDSHLPALELARLYLSSKQDRNISRALGMLERQKTS